MMILCLLLSGCGAGQETEKALRQPYQDMSGCVAEADITCGVGAEDALTFTVRCDYVPEGECTVEVLAPETIAGIKAVVDGENLSVVYEELCLNMGTLSREQVSPAACVPYLMNALRDGWLLEENEENWGEVPCVRLCLDETGAQGGKIVSALWLRQEDGVPIHGEIAVDDEIILSAEFTSFQFYDTMTNQNPTQDEAP